MKTNHLKTFTTVFFLSFCFCCNKAQTFKTVSHGIIEFQIPSNWIQIKNPKGGNDFMFNYADNANDPHQILVIMQLPSYTEYDSFIEAVFDLYYS